MPFPKRNVQFQTLKSELMGTAAKQQVAEHIWLAPFTPYSPPCLQAIEAAVPQLVPLPPWKPSSFSTFRPEWSLGVKNLITSLRPLHNLTLAKPSVSHRTPLELSTLLTWFLKCAHPCCSPEMSCNSLSAPQPSFNSAPYRVSLTSLLQGGALPACHGRAAAPCSCPTLGRSPSAQPSSCSMAVTSHFHGTCLCAYGHSACLSRSTLSSITAAIKRVSAGIMYQDMTQLRCQMITCWMNETMKLHTCCQNTDNRKPGAQFWGLWMLLKSSNV